LEKNQILRDFENLAKKGYLRVVPLLKVQEN